LRKNVKYIPLISFHFILYFIFFIIIKKSTEANEEKKENLYFHHFDFVQKNRDGEEDEEAKSHPAFKFTHPF
jgi:hypothetical protein